MSLRLFAATVAVSVMATAALPAHAVGISARSLISSFNNIVLNDLNTTVETQGTLYVGGNYTGGATVNPDNLANVDLGNGIVGSLVIGGNYNGGNINMQNGDVVVGGSINGNINNNGGGNISDNVSGIPVGLITSLFQDFSTELAGFSDTGGTANTADQNNINFVSVPDANNVAVFNIDGSVLQSGTYQGVAAAAGVTTVVNVSGKNVTVGVNGNTVQSSVIFNFFEAETLQINSAFNSSILAPLADVVLQGGGIKGTLVTNNLTQNAEVRPPVYDGTIPPPVSTVPLPAPVLLLLSGIAALFGAAYRRPTARNAA